MIKSLIIATLVLGCTAFAVQAADDKKEEPAGGVKGAIVGGAAGSQVGEGHTAAGAATGAAVGHHQHEKWEKEQEKK